MKKLLAISVATALCVGIASHAFAGTNPSVNLALDMQVKTKTRSCTSLATAYTSCSAVNQSVSGLTSLTPLDVMPVAYIFTGITVLDFGLDWHSTATIYNPTWTKCSDLDITTFRATSASITTSWSTCQAPPAGANSGKAAGLVRFSVYGTGSGRVDIVAADSGHLYAVDCNFNTDDFHTIHNGFYNGAVPGPGDLNPCTAGPTAAQPTTWSGVKALYR